MKTIFECIGKENPTLQEIDDWICKLAQESSSVGDGKRWTKESRTAICRWVLRSLVYGELKMDVLKYLGHPEFNPKLSTK